LGSSVAGFRVSRRKNVNDTKDYDSLSILLRRLLSKSGESYRQASLAAGLPNNAISRYLKGTRPGRDACIALADHFGINPNEMLQAAGYEPMRLFDRRLEDPEAIAPEVEALAAEIMAIEDDAVRQEMVQALRQILQVNMEMREKAIERAAGRVGSRSEKAADTKAST
jgi:transcriptional regulator with XRE-family HTH domain